MKIKLLGFRLELNPALSFAELTTKLTSQSGKPTQHAGSTWILKVKDQGKYVVGSLVAIKGQRKFPQIDINSLKLSVQELEKGKNLASFNFFVISKRNQNGLYSHYFGSTSVSALASLLNSIGKAITEPRKTAELKAVAETGPIGKAKKNAIRERYKDAVTCSYLVSKPQLENVLANWQRLKTLEYTVTHLEPGTRPYAGLQPFVRAETTRLALDKESAFDVVRKAVLRYVKDLNYDRGRVEGVDDAGVERIINLLNTPDWFGELDYSGILSEPSLFADDLNQCCLIQHLIHEAEENPAHFDIDVR